MTSIRGNHNTVASTEQQLIPRDIEKHFAFGDDSDLVKWVAMVIDKGIRGIDLFKRLQPLRFKHHFDLALVWSLWSLPPHDYHLGNLLLN
jgi:hypothetical protein